MGVIKMIKAFFMKKHYDFSSPDIDLYNFHPQLRIFIIPMGIFFHNKNSLLRFIWPTVAVSLTVVALVLELIFVHHGLLVKDYAFATECFCYLVLLGVIPLIYGSMIFNRTNILQILDSMNRDFIYICKLDSRYRETFLSAQHFIWKLCFAWMGFVILVGITMASMTLVPLLYLCLFATIDEHTVRPLVFPMWLPKDDPHRTPNYEIFMFLELDFLFLFVQTFGVYVYIQFHVLLHNISLLELIILNIEVLLEDLDECAMKLPRDDVRRIAVKRQVNSRLKRIVNWHNSVLKSTATLSSVQGAPLIYQVMFSSIAVCLMLYQMAEKLDQGKLDVSFGMLMSATIMQLFFPCCLGTILRNKAFAVGDACYNCGWQETSLGSMVRTDLLILMVRTQKPLSIKYTGLPHLSLETFSSVMSTSYSYFNMLRQYN